MLGNEVEDCVPAWLAGPERNAAADSNFLLNSLWVMRSQSQTMSGPKDIIEVHALVLDAKIIHGKLKRGIRACILSHSAKVRSPCIVHVHSNSGVAA